LTTFLFSLFLASHIALHSFLALFVFEESLSETYQVINLMLNCNRWWHCSFYSFKKLNYSFPSLLLIAIVIAGPLWPGVVNPDRAPAMHYTVSFMGRLCSSVRQVENTCPLWHALQLNLDSAYWDSLKEGGVDNDSWATQ